MTNSITTLRRKIISECLGVLPKETPYEDYPDLKRSSDEDASYHSGYDFAIRDCRKALENLRRRKSHA